MATQTDEPKVAPFSKFRELTRDIHVAMLTTHSRDGALHSRPMGTRQVENDGMLWFFTADDSAKVRDIYEDQLVNVSYADHRSQVYVSVTGRATLSHDRQRIRELWTPMLKAWFPGGPDDPDIALIQVEIQTIDYWEGSGKIVSLLKFAKSTLTDTSSKLGDHGAIIPPPR